MTKQTVIQKRESEEVEFFHTGRIQSSSVLNFARELGYEYSQGVFIFKGRNSSGQDYKCRAIISFNSMVSLHNREFVRHGYESCRFGYQAHKYDPHMPFDKEDRARAVFAKTVKVAKLQYSKKQKKTIVQDHQVEFVQ